MIAKMDDSRLVVIGASGHAKVVIDIIEKQGTDQIAFVIDDNPALMGALLYDYPVVGGRLYLVDQAARHDVKRAIVAIGNNATRMEIASWLRSNGFLLGMAIHPSAQIGRGAIVGAGTVVMAGTVINSDSMVGENAIINTGVSVDHDCNIGNGVHIAPGGQICGGVRIGERSFIGAGSTIVPNVQIGQNVVVGAGATLLHDVPDGAKVVGSPAKRIG